MFKMYVGTATIPEQVNDEKLKRCCLDSLVFARKEIIHEAKIGEQVPCLKCGEIMTYDGQQWK